MLPFKCKHCICFQPKKDVQLDHQGLAVIKPKQEDAPVPGECRFNPPSMFPIPGPQRNTIQFMSVYTNVNSENGCMQFIPSDDAPSQVKDLFAQFNA